MARDGLDIPPRIPCPGGCGRTVQLKVETDGDGDLVETARACRRCRPRRIFVVPDGHIGRFCLRCERPFLQEQRASAGRYKMICGECRR